MAINQLPDAPESTSNTCLPVFNLLFGGGSTRTIRVSTVRELDTAGQIVSLIADYHAFEFDTPGYPGMGTLSISFRTPSSWERTC